MTKILYVASEVQKAVLEKVLLQEICFGFWKNTRPSDHISYWKNVTVEIGPNLGPAGFEIPRNYNFVNPVFYKKNEEKLLEAAKTVNINITSKQLKKQLILLNQIIGARLNELGGQATKLHRGRKPSVSNTPVISEKKTATVTVRKAIANIVEESIN